MSRRIDGDHGRAVDALGMCPRIYHGNACAIALAVKINAVVTQRNACSLNVFDYFRHGIAFQVDVEDAIGVRHQIEALAEAVEDRL